MSPLIRSFFVLFALLGAALPASAHPEYTIYIDTSQYEWTDAGMIGGQNLDEIDQAAR